MLSNFSRTQQLVNTGTRIPTSSMLMQSLGQEPLRSADTGEARGRKATGCMARFVVPVTLKHNEIKQKDQENPKWGILEGLILKKVLLGTS